MKILGFLLITSCGFIVPFPGMPQPTCKTICGQLLFENQDCAGFQEAENRVLKFVAPAFPEVNACKALRNFRVSTRPAIWIDQWGRKVGGFSGCDKSPGQNGYAVVLNNWHELSYFHEAAHHFQCPFVDYEHREWELIFPVVSQAAK